MSEKDNVFDYVMNSPEDTNPSVLRSLLNDIPEGGSGSQELPTPSADNVGKVAAVVSDGSGNYSWDATDVPSPIDDSTSSSSKTYSSQKIETLLGNELPAPTQSIAGMIAKVSYGGGGYAWTAATLPIRTPGSGDIGHVATVIADGRGGYVYDTGAVAADVVILQSNGGSYSLVSETSDNAIRKAVLNNTPIFLYINNYSLATDGPIFLSSSSRGYNPDIGNSQDQATIVFMGFTTTNEFYDDGTANSMVVVEVIIDSKTYTEGTPEYSYTINAYAYDFSITPRS